MNMSHKTTDASRRAFLRASAAGLGAVALNTRTAISADEPPIPVVVWDERQPSQKEAYPNFLGNAIADHLKSQPGFSVKSVALDDPGQGLTDEILGPARVLIWWGHVRQGEVTPESGRKIVDRIKEGTLSLIALHSAHWATPFVEAMNARTRLDVLKSHNTNSSNTEVHEVAPAKRYTVPKSDERITPNVREKRYPNGSRVLDLHLPICCFPAYRNDGKPSYLRVLKPEHPIVAGVPAAFEIPREEMYNEPFHVPEPDEVILEERWAAGEWFRAGMVWNIGKGRVFYFRPGHETYPTYTRAEPLAIVTNAARWLGKNA